MARQVGSRRLPGANVFGERPGAILDIQLEGDRHDAVVEVWTEEARRVLHALSWVGEPTAFRCSGDDLSLFLGAPADVLYAATEANELAWACTESVLGGSPEPELEPAIDAVRRAVAGERNPALLALREAAARRGLAFVSDDRQATVGLGRGGATFPSDALPAPEGVPWERLSNVPVVMITGTNGKSTTVRLLGAIVEAWGRVAGLSTTDGLRVGHEAIGSGDYSGPEGARRILRDPRVEVAVLETARGGIQRRGLVLPRVDAAAITNVASDHLGEFGVHTLDDIAEIKWVVARAVRSGGTLVLNGDEPLLEGRPVREEVRVARFSVAGAAELLDVSSIPIAFGGAAKHNVANAMAAALLARGLGIPDETIARGLSSFRGGPDENPGRLNVVPLGGATLLVDYAHNPHGMEALVEVAKSLPASRRLLLIGQAGDRDDDAIRALARAGWSLGPDAVVIKEMPDYLRGRVPGEIPRVIEDELRRLGAAHERIVHAATEVDGVRVALAWAREGDLLVLTTHSNRSDVFALIDKARRTSWRVGQPVPA